MAELLYTDLGRMDYPAALALQERIVELKQRESLADVMLFVEHPHVYTLGRGGKESNVLASAGSAGYEDEPRWRRYLSRPRPIGRLSAHRSTLETTQGRAPLSEKFGAERHAHA